MKLEIMDRKRNPLMKREEALISIEHGGKATPNRKQVLDELAKLLKVKTDAIIIDRIITQGGQPRSDIKVFAYSKREDIPAWRLKRMEQRMAKKKEEKPPEAPPEKPEEKPEKAEKEAEEKPAEPSREEKPEEKPPEAPEEEPTEEEGPKEAKEEQA